MWMPPRPALLLAVCGAVGACSNDHVPTGPVSGRIAVTPQPALIPSAADGSALPINRIRAVTTSSESGDTLDDRSVDVSSDADEWEIVVELPGPAPTSSVVVTIHLLHVAGDSSESIEFSGRTDPFDVARGRPVTPTVTIVRGPLANLFTTAVSMTSAPSTMFVDSVATLAATASVSDGPSPTIFWTALDPTILALDGPVATALSPGTARVVASAGAYADTAQIQVTTEGSAVLLGSFSPGLGVLVSVALDPATSNLFIYDDFAAEIFEYTQDGDVVAPAIPRPGPSSNDIDLDFLPVSTTIGSTVVPSNSLLVINGEINPGVVIAIDKNDGAVADSIAMPAGSGNSVGGAFDPEQGHLFTVDWTTDVISEIDLATATTVSTFAVGPTGAPPFTVYYGNIDINPATGNIVVVSSDQSTVRVLTSTGAWVRDVDVGGLGISGMSGIAWDEATGTAWIVSTTGYVFHVAGID